MNKSNWSKLDAAAWDKTWNEPHMRKGMELILNAAQPRPPAAMAIPGIDYTALAAQRSGIYEGRYEVIGIIESLRGEQTAISQLSEPYSWVDEEQETKTK
jgi:hypothetical protein